MQNPPSREHFPYLECIFKEVLRWHVAAPAGLPHRTTEATEYRGALQSFCSGSLLLTSPFTSLSVNLRLVHPQGKQPT